MSVHLTISNLGQLTPIAPSSPAFKAGFPSFAVASLVQELPRSDKNSANYKTVTRHHCTSACYIAHLTWIRCTEIWSSTIKGQVSNIKTLVKKS